jgi:6,7-dimethyl-8-ribityllumazine synthase
MSNANKNLNEYDGILPDGSRYSIGIALSEWNHEITTLLLKGAMEALESAKVPEAQIHLMKVPGTYELPLAAKWLTNSGCDSVICLGCVIQGETRHFDFICQATAQGIMNLGLETSKPIIFGILTTDNLQQAYDRAGGKYGNKGFEAGVTALKMLQNNPL